MSSETPVRLTGIGKCYQTYKKPIYRLIQHLYRSNHKLYDEFWALTDINLEVRRGETLGIIGKNGSGKSTLLQIIAGILTPSVGNLATNGRISALLELGAGFNPEFTGRENARLNASIMGLTRDEFDQRFPDIIEFSELGNFIDKPVKTYSSGMYVRLAFSVAISMRPDILIIDEALAVGDIRFQRKCFRKLQELRNAGITILFVTHSTESVVNHCNRAVHLDDGRIVGIGEPKEIVNQYLEAMFGLEGEKHDSEAREQITTQADVHLSAQSFGFNTNPHIDACMRQPSYNSSEYRWGDRRASIIDYRVEQDGEEVAHTCIRGRCINVFAMVFFSEALSNLIYGITVKTVDGTSVYGTNTRLKKIHTGPKRAGQLSLIQFSLELNLLASDYFISLGVAVDDKDRDNIAIDRRYDLIHIKVEDAGDAFGVAELNAQIYEKKEAV